MATLADFPLITQRTPVSFDGKSPNANFDCVPTSILAGLMYLHGVSALDTAQWNPAKLMSMAGFAADYVGPTAAADFVKACASLDCTLYPIGGAPGQLVQHIHEQLQQEHPCIVTVPDIYVPASYGWTHVLCAYSESPGYITMLDPWPGKPTTKSDAEWIQLLLFNQIWVLERAQKVEEEMVAIDLNNPEVSKYFELASSDGASWRCRSNGKILQLGMLAFYKAFGNSELCGLTYLGLPQSNEIPMDSEGNTKQYFENGVLFYDPHHKYDTRPGTSNPETRPVYLAHLYSPNSPATDPRLAPLQAQLSELQAQLAVASNPALASELQAAQSKLAQVKAIVS